MSARLTAAVVLLAIAATASSQSYSSWIFLGSNSPPNLQIAAGRVDTTGNVTTIVAQSALPAGGFTEGGTMDIDNKTYVLGLKGLPQSTFLLADASGSILGSVVIGNQGTPIVDVTLDSDGDYIVLEGPKKTAPSLFRSSLLEVDRAGNVTATLWRTNSFSLLAKAVVRDIETGDYLVLCDSNSFVDRTIVLRVARDGSSANTLGKSSAIGMNQITQDVDRGEYYVGGWALASNPAVILKLDRQGNFTTLIAGGFDAGYSVHTDRTSAQQRRIAFGSAGSTPGVFFTDLTGQTVTTVTRAPHTYEHLFPDRGRNVVTSGNGFRRWAIALDFPGEAGNRYVVALSIAGTRRGTPLPDGRRLPLVIDALTALSVNGQLSPLLTGHAGTLNVAGSATALIDVSSLPPLPGVTVAVLAVTLNANAPLGIQTIPDPTLLVLK